MVSLPRQIAEYRTSTKDAFYSKLCSCNPLETENNDFVNQLKTGMTTEQTVVKLKISKPLSAGVENYRKLATILETATNDIVERFFVLV